MKIEFEKGIGVLYQNALGRPLWRGTSELRCNWIEYAMGMSEEKPYKEWIL